MNDPDPRRVLASRLRDLRERWPGRRVSQHELAAALGADGRRSVSAPLISSWESLTNPKVPPQSRIEDIATFFASPRSFDGHVGHLLSPDEMTVQEKVAREELLQELTRLRREVLDAGPYRPGVTIPAALNSYALLAVGTAVYASPEFEDLDKVPRSLKTIVDTLTRLGYATVSGSPGYTINPELHDLRLSLRRVSRAAPVVLVYYTGYAAQENGTLYLIGRDSRYADLGKTAALAVDLLGELSRQDDVGVIGQPQVLIVLDCIYSEPAALELLSQTSTFVNPNMWVIASTSSLKNSQQGEFVAAFTQAIEQRAKAAPPHQRFLDLEGIVRDINSTGRAGATLFPPPTGSVGLPPFFPNPSYEPTLQPGSSDTGFEEPHTATAARLIVPAITDDATEGHPDRLGIDSDARALAALVASRRLEPPLAIGLYGEWGTGKTFFMKRVQASVEDLTTSGASEVFCSAVAPVWFSAWQYAGGTLWASLLHHIFASLYPLKPRPQLALDEVMARVQSAQQVTSAAEEHVEAATTRLDVAAQAITAAEDRHRKALEDSSKLRAKDLWDAVALTAEDEDLKNQVVGAANDLGLTVASDSAQEIVRATRQVVDLASRTRVLATSGPWYRSPLALAIYAALIVGSLGLLIGAAVHAEHQWAGTAITAIGQLAAVGSAAAAWTIRQGGIARHFIAPAETLQQRLEGRLAKQQAANEHELVALEQEAGTAKAELIVALQQHAEAEKQLASAEKEQTELTGKRLLSRYLAERANSNDYDHYMGVVALAHRDLVDLEAYLHAAIDDNNGKDGFDRIILYIDDLDRCDPDVVASVLDAVHLLLALPLFVVIVGVDPRWLKRALRERHPELLEPTSSSVPTTSPTDYLEKIFQLTYSLPSMSPDSCANLLVTAAQATQVLPVSQDQSREISQPDIELASLNADEETEASSFSTGTAEARDTALEDSRQLPPASAEDLAEALTMHKEDIEALRDVAPLVSISPRRAKRFLSIYLVIRARALGDPMLRERLGGNEGMPDSRSNNSLLVLVALLVGLPKIMAASIRDSQLSNTIHATGLGAWLREAVQTAPEEQARLQAFLSMEPSIALLPMDAVMQWLPLARPYLPFELEELQD